MIKEKLISQARSIFHEIKKKERNTINPYISFASQIGTQIEQDKLKNKEDIIKFTGLSYSRPRMNYQWRNFNKVLNDRIPSNADKDTLLLLFGYLKRVLTIEAKKEYDSPRPKPQRKPGRHDHRRNHHHR